MIILGDLLGGVASLNLRETGHQDVLGKRPHICLIEAAMVKRMSGREAGQRRKVGLQHRTILLDEQHPLDGDRRKRVNDVVVCLQVLDQQRKNREQLLFRKL